MFRLHYERYEKMKLKLFSCPECKCRRFTSINGLNVHLTKSHNLNYKILIRNNKAYKKKKSQRSSAIEIKN